MDLVANLSDAERREFHVELEGCFAGSSVEWERAWSVELSRRLSQIENNEVELVEGDDVVMELRADAGP